MQRLVERLRGQLVDFVEQREDVLCLARCDDNDCAVVLRLVRDIEQADDADLHLLFSGEFTSADAWLDEVVAQFAEQHRIASKALEDAGKGSLPPFPTDAVQRGRRAPDRLLSLVQFAQTLVPPKQGSRLVWVMLPWRIDDVRAWSQLLAPFAAHRGVETWMRGLRIIGRVPLDPEVQLRLDAPRTRVLGIDLGPEAQARSLREDAEDASLPDERRMQAVLMLASLDHARGRGPEAVEKYKLVLGYYQHVGNVLMQAIVMHGLGEVFHRRGDHETGRYWYECAMEPAATSEAPVVLLTLARSLGELSMEQKRYSEARQCFDGVGQLAAKLGDSETRARALEWRGWSEWLMNAQTQAIATWEASARLCRNVGLDPLLSSTLERLEAGYRSLGLDDRADAARRERQALPRQEHTHG